jgi:hypothetical protein
MVNRKLIVETGMELETKGNQCNSTVLPTECNKKLMNYRIL